MRATAAATRSATVFVLAAPAETGPTSTAVLSWRAGTGCSPRANVAYSFLHTLDWLREKLHHIVSHSADRRTRPGPADTPVLRDNVSREKGKTMPVARSTGAASV